MSIWNRLHTFCFIRYACFRTWWEHANTEIKSYLYIIEHIEVLDEFLSSKNPDLTRFFMIKSRRPCRLKKQIWVKKSAVGALVTRAKTPNTVTWSECLRIYYGVIVTQQRPTVEPGTLEHRLGSKSWGWWKLMKNKKIITTYPCYCSTTMLTSKIIK